MTDAGWQEPSAARPRAAFCTFAALWAVLIERLFWLPPDQDASIRFDLYIAVTAVIAAGAAGWCAGVFGCRDHGWLAGAFAGPLFGVFLTLPLAASFLFSSPAMVLDTITSGVELGVSLAPYALVGTGVFLGLLSLKRYARRRLAR